MKLYELAINLNDFEESEITLIVYGYKISEHPTLEVQDGWCAGEPVNDPCDDECVYLMNSGGTLSTLQVLENNGFTEA